MEPARPPVLKRLTVAHWIVLDCLAALLMVSASVVLARGLSGPTGPSWSVAVVVAVSVIGAALRRHWPRAALAIVVLAGPVGMGTATFPAPWLAVAFVMYMIPLQLPRREALWLLAGTFLVSAAGLAVASVAPFGRPGPNRVGLLLEGGLLITIAWTVGYAMRQQRMYDAGLRGRAQRQAQEQVAEARRAMSEERLRIARELHDVMAHTMSVIAVQSGVANHIATERPEEARRALASIEETSRDALREIRALLGVLRNEQQPDVGTAPAPGLHELDVLVQRAAEAGVHVDVRTSDATSRLPAGLGLATYRIVQEAITNVIKHAATDRCEVHMVFGPGAFTVRISDDGRGTAGRAGDPAVGHGIAGMRERVVMYGGSFEAGPQPGRGFQVMARFPLTNWETT